MRAVAFLDADNLDPLATRFDGLRECFALIGFTAQTHDQHARDVGIRSETGHCSFSLFEVNADLGAAGRMLHRNRVKLFAADALDDVIGAHDRGQNQHVVARADRAIPAVVARKG